MSEFQDRGLTTSTKMASADAITKLYKLRQFMMGTWGFDAIARQHGKLVLREACGRDVTDDTVNALVDETLEILRKVTHDQLN